MAENERTEPRQPPVREAPNLILGGRGSALLNTSPLNAWALNAQPLRLPTSQAALSTAGAVEPVLPLTPEPGAEGPADANDRVRHRERSRSRVELAQRGESVADEQRGLGAAVRAATGPTVPSTTSSDSMANSQQVTLETSVTRATVAITPTFYLPQPGSGIVVYNHIIINPDSNEFHALAAKIDELISLLHQSNEIAGETREKLIAEMQAGMTILKSPKPDPKMIDLLLKMPLLYISEKAGSAMIGAAAVGALMLLGKVTGLW
jgi:hypothetical protein